VIVAHVHALSVLLAGCKLYSTDAVITLLTSSSNSELPVNNETLSSYPTHTSVSFGTKVFPISAKCSV